MGQADYDHAQKKEDGISLSNTAIGVFSLPVPLAVVYAVYAFYNCKMDKIQAFGSILSSHYIYREINAGLGDKRFPKRDKQAKNSCPGFCIALLLEYERW